MTDLVHLLTTIDTRAQALRLAHDAVEDRVAACVQIAGPITSVYRWQGRIEEVQEFVCLFKTPADGLQALVAFVRDRHPYDTPELTAVPSSFVDERYLAWVTHEVRPG
jgi:periplasmic divalent cation tolerance protein